MTPEEMSEEVRLTALEQHIQEALRKADLPPMDAAKFRQHLARVQNALDRLRSTYAAR